MFSLSPLLQLNYNLREVNSFRLQEFAIHLFSDLNRTKVETRNHLKKRGGTEKPDEQ
jgi:hypothetical protein